MPSANDDASTIRHTALETETIVKDLIMQRRDFNQTGIGALGILIPATHQQAHPLTLGNLTNQEASNGLRTALEKDALAAVALLGKPDRFLVNPKVRIPPLGYLENAARLLRNFGQGKRIDELVTSINRSAEAAVPVGQDPVGTGSAILTRVFGAMR